MSPPPGEQDFEHVQAHFTEINRAAGATLAVTATEEAPHAPDYLGMADIVVGVGRTAFEGMLFAKPTVIVGKVGFAGLVGCEDIEQLAFYNFSGRHRTRAPYAMSVTELTDTLRKLLEDRELYERVGEFGRTYVLENLDANAAAGRYEARYHTFSPSDYPTDEQLAKHLNLTPKRVIRGLMPKKLYPHLEAVLGSSLPTEVVFRGLAATMILLRGCSCLFKDCCTLATNRFQVDLFLRLIHDPIQPTLARRTNASWLER